MPYYINQKGVALIPIIVVVVLIFVGGMFLLKPPERSSNPFKKTSQKTQGELIDGYPHQCEKRMGFDNWRTFNSFAIDPKDPQTLYVAIEYKGVYKSQDGGKSWSIKNKGFRGYPNQKNPQIPCQEQHPLLVIDPANSSRLLITSASSPGYLKDMNSESGGVYESLDGGESWHQLFNETMNAWTYEAMTIDPDEPKTIYVGTTAMPASFDEADPNKLFVTKGIVYKTTDGGKAWNELQTGFVPHLRSGRLFINPNDSNQIIFTTYALPPNKGGGKILSKQMGILESKDGGKTWQKLESLPENARAITEADIAAKNFQNMFILVSISNELQERFFSTDGGKTFTKVDTQVSLFKFDPHDTKGLRLLGLNVYTFPRTIFESLDGGKSWSPYSELPKDVSNETRVSNIVWDPKNKDLVYLNGDEGNIWKSKDNGKQWENILNLNKLPK